MAVHDDGRIGTLVHAADLHLGAPLKSIGNGVDEDIAEGLRNAANQAFDKLVKLVLEQEADVLVLAGDVYDGMEHEVSAQLRFVEGLRDLVQERETTDENGTVKLKKGVKVFITHGNHDPVVASFQPAITLPEEVVVFQPGQPQKKTIELDSGTKVDIVGVSFGSQSETTNLVKLFHGLSVASHAIGVVHANVIAKDGKQTGHGRYAECSEVDLEVAPIGYWALGHVHKRQHHPMGPNRWWAYSGNLQGGSTLPRECGPKGALVVPIMPNGFGEPEFKACAGVQFANLNVDVGNASNVDEALQEAVVELDQVFAGLGSLPMVAEVNFVGESHADKQLRDEGDELTEHLRKRWGGNRPIRVVSKVKVKTRPGWDRSKILAEQSLRSVVLEHLDEIRKQINGETPDDDGISPTVETALITPLEEKSNAIAAKRLRELLRNQPERLDEVIEEAERILMTLLLGES